jgi:hypothetical protein
MRVYEYSVTRVFAIGDPQALFYEDANSCHSRFFTHETKIDEDLFPLLFAVSSNQMRQDARGDAFALKCTNAMKADVDQCRMRANDTSLVPCTTRTNFITLSSLMHINSLPVG